MPKVGSQKEGLLIIVLMKAELWNKYILSEIDKNLLLVNFCMLKLKFYWISDSQNCKYLTFWHFLSAELQFLAIFQGKTFRFSQNWSFKVALNSLFGKEFFRSVFLHFSWELNIEKDTHSFFYQTLDENLSALIKSKNLFCELETKKMDYLR